MQGSSASFFQKIFIMVITVRLTEGKLSFLFVLFQNNGFYSIKKAGRSDQTQPYFKTKLITVEN